MGSQTPTYLNENQTHIIESWGEFQELVAGPKYRRWAFRGQGKSEWPLNTTLSRYLIDYKVHQDSWAHQEARIIRIFRRKAGLFLQHVPKEDDVFEWLALMQHHGAPSRLLDFTWSPFVAAFFALEKAKTDCAVWAVNFSILKDMEYNFPLEKSSHRKTSRKNAPRPEDLKNYARFFLYNTVPFVTPGEPYNMNQRQIAQSGT